MNHHWASPGRKICILCVSSFDKGHSFEGIFIISISTFIQLSKV